MSAPADAIAPVLSAADLADLLARRRNVRLLDVRTPSEFASVHIRGSYNVPLDLLGEHADEIAANVETPLVLICRSGSRARRAEDALKRAGMRNLHLLDGGIEAWIAAGQSVVRGPERISLERQVRIVAGGIAFVGGLLALTVNRLFGIVPAAIGGGLVFAGLTDTCVLAMLLAKLPYNRSASCDVDAMVQALTNGSSPATAYAPAPAPWSCSR